MQDRISKATTRNIEVKYINPKTIKKDRKGQNKKRNRLSKSKVGRSKKGRGEGIGVGGVDRLYKKTKASQKYQ